MATYQIILNCEPGIISIEADGYDAVEEADEWWYRFKGVYPTLVNPHHVVIMRRIS